jgi:hypothetical protein
MPDAPLIAVLTGDLVASQQAGAAKVEAAMAQLKQTAEDLSEIVGHDMRFTRFRGDGWQMVIKDPSDTLTATLLILADLRATGLNLDTRIAIGIGSADNLGTDNLSDAKGQAFVLSGRLLDEMPRKHTIDIAGGPKADYPWRIAVVDLVAWQASHWTAAQATAMATTLRNPFENQQTMANRLKITRQAMQSRLASAGMQPIASAVMAFKNANWEQDL